MKRVDTTELMEDPAILIDELEDALASIDRAHWLLSTYSNLLDKLKELSGERESPITLVDIGSGSGYLGDVINKRLSGKVQYIPVDHDHRILNQCNNQSNKIRAGATKLPFNPGSIDVVVTSLTLHHLPAEDLVPFLKYTDELGSEFTYHLDLYRSPQTYVLLWLGSRLISRNSIFHNDAPLSVQRSLSKQEWTELLRRPEINNYEFIDNNLFMVDFVAN